MSILTVVFLVTQRECRPVEQEVFKSMTELNKLVLTKDYSEHALA